MSGALRPVPADTPGAGPDPVPTRDLFQPLALGPGLTLPNRIVLAPCTRNRATADRSPTAGAVDYYASRADAGLLITEAIMVAPQVQGYLDTPGLYLESHVRAWAAVCEAVHRRGGRIVAQLWHTGRLAHSHWTGEQPVAPSAVLDPVLRRQAGGVELYNEMPRALEPQEVVDTIELFRQAARRARTAGFDGIEIHGANGYLIEQFLRAHTNRRTDAWGGSTAARTRFAMEVVRACIDTWGPGRVGLRLSPAAYFGEMRWSEADNETYRLLLALLRPMRLAYLHTGVVDDRHYGEIGGTSTEFLRRHGGGVLIANGGYSGAAGAALLARGLADAVSFGRSFIANPDLVARLREGTPLRAYGPEALKALR